MTKVFRHQPASRTAVAARFLKYRVVLLLASVTVSLMSSCRVRIQHSADSTSAALPVTEVASLNIKDLSQLISELFELRDPPSKTVSAIPSPFNNFVSAKVTGDKELKISSAAARANDSLLKAYGSLSTIDREYDVYLSDPLRREWLSEYRSGDSALPFYSSFIVHLSSDTDLRTTISILEFEPYVRASNLSFWGLTHSGSPGIIADITYVSPTYEERSALLTIIHDLIASNSK